MYSNYYPNVSDFCVAAENDGCMNISRIPLQRVLLLTGFNTCLIPGFILSVLFVYIFVVICVPFLCVILIKSVVVTGHY